MDGEPFAPSSGTPMPPAFLWRGKTTDAWPRFPSSMTCSILTEDHGEALLKWFLEASRAPTYPSPGEEQASTEKRPACGSTWPESLARFDPNTSSWKTRQCLLFEDSTESLETFPRWGLMRDGELWALSTPEHLINENGSGLWPTPDVRGFTNDGSLQMLSKKCASREEWSRMAFRKGVSAKQKLWPTPTCQDASNNGGKSQHGRHTKPLNAEVGGALNPPWVEWLMGWPLEWTASGAAATAKFRQWCASHGIS